MARQNQMVRKVRYARDEIQRLAIFIRSGACPEGTLQEEGPHGLAFVYQGLQGRIDLEFGEESSESNYELQIFIRMTWFPISPSDPNTPGKTFEALAEAPFALSRDTDTPGRWQIQSGRRWSKGFGWPYAGGKNSDGLLERLLSHFAEAVALMEAQGLT